MNALAAKLRDAGVEPRNIQLQLALARFMNNGGTYGVALAMLNAAYGKGSVGHSRSADEGQSAIADAPSDGGGGHTTDANKASSLLPAARRPPNPPRGITSIASVQSTLARSLFDSTVLPDGRRLREVRWSECPALATKYRRVAHVLIAVHNHAIPPDQSATLDTIVSEAELQKIIADAEKSNAQN